MVFTAHCETVLGLENTPNLDFINGITCYFENNGKQGIVEMEYTDLSKMVIQFKSGSLNGKAYLFDRFKRVRAIGLYKNGLPHGPFWIKNEQQYCFVNFHNGKLGSKRLLLNFKMLLHHG